MSARSAPRALVSANFALTWDGRVSTRNKTPSDFSSPTDKRRLLEIRAGGDAVLAGAATIAADQMSMGLPAADLRQARIERGQSEYPLRVLISNSGQIASSLKIFEQTFSPILIFSTQKMPPRVRQRLSAKATLHLSDEATVDLQAMLTLLRKQYGVRRLICEGGPTLFQSLLQANLVDELHLTLCPRVFGGELAPTLTGTPAPYLPKSTALRLREMDVIAGECFLRYRTLAAQPS